MIVENLAHIAVAHRLQSASHASFITYGVDFSVWQLVGKHTRLCRFQITILYFCFA